MAFDFNSGKKPRTPTNSPSRTDIDYSNQDAAPRPPSEPRGFSSPPTHTGSSGFQNKPSGFSAGPATDSDENRSSGFQNKPAGFQNRPESRPRDTETGIRPKGNLPARTPQRTPAKRPVAHSGRQQTTGSSIPWNVVLPIIGIAFLVILCVVFREAITEFLVQVLTWVIIVLVIIFLVKWFIFGGRRR